MREMIVRNQGSTRDRKIDINEIIKTSDYHFVMAFKHNKDSKDLMVELFDPPIKKNFKLACLDKAIDFLQMVKSKISGDNNKELEQMMNRKGVVKEDIAPFIKEEMKPTRQQASMESVLAKTRPINDEMTFVTETLDQYFKGIEFEKKILTCENTMILKLDSKSVDAKSVFNKFKFEFWDRYYQKVLKPKIGDYTIVFKFGS